MPCGIKLRPAAVSSQRQASTSTTSNTRAPSSTERNVLAALIADRFKGAFKTKPRLPDKRSKVFDVAALKSVVDAVMAGTEDQLADQSLKALGAAVRRWLADRGKKATRGNICAAISQKDKGKWKGEKPATLRDNLYRPPGKRKERAERDWLLAQLTRARDALNTTADTAPDVEP